MLNTTLTDTFDPATNLKGDVAGANWAFLLPRLPSTRVVCIGAPSTATFKAVCRIARDVLVVASDIRQFRKIDAFTQRHALDNVRLAIMSRDGALPFPSDYADLALISGRHHVRELSGDPAWLAEIRRTLSPQGLMYFEWTGVERRPGGDRISPAVKQNFTVRQTFWLTPLLGEMQTAVPEDDRSTCDYFLQRRLYSVSIRFATFANWTRRLRPGRTGHSPRPSRRTTASVSHSRSSRSWRPWLRSCGARALQTIERAERLMVERGVHLRRHGVLLSPVTDDAPERPPEYLCTIARRAGVDLTGHTWGLSARGGYQSRKILFYLFDRLEQSSGNPRATYVVKLVREPEFNARLENEHRGLSLLRDMGIRNSEGAPRAAFFGYHHGLAVLGETAIEGRPFRERTTAAADCPYFHDAIDWLISLGAATSDSTIANAEQIAARLRILFTRFSAIYPLAPAEYAFLADQISSVAQSQQAFPMVFQHGDPGPWNVIVTPAGRVAFLDWEANEPSGMPLWDLLYFLGSYAVYVARAAGIQDRSQAFASQFLAESSIGRLVVQFVSRYCERTGLATCLIEPLFYMCWVHRALKESTRLTPARLRDGAYFSLLRVCIEQREAPTLRRLFCKPL